MYDQDTVGRKFFQRQSKIQKQFKGQKDGILSKVDSISEDSPRDVGGLDSDNLVRAKLAFI